MGVKSENFKEQVATNRRSGVPAAIRLPGSDQRNPLVLIEFGLGIEPFSPLNGGFHYQKAQLMHTQIK
jgi:hypothetical protein